MERTEVMEMVKQQVAEAVTEQVKLQGDVLKEDLSTELKAQMETSFSDMSTKMQASFDGLKSLFETKAEEGKQSQETEQKPVEKTQAEVIALAVTEALKSAGLAKEEKVQNTTEEPQDLNVTLASLKQQMDDLVKATTGRQTAKRSVTTDAPALTAAQRAEIIRRKKEAPFDDDPCFMPELMDEDPFATGEDE